MGYLDRRYVRNVDNEMREEECVLQATELFAKFPMNCFINVGKIERVE